MSRPPRPHLGATTTGAPEPGRDRLDYLPDRLDDFVRRQQELAARELQLVSSGGEGEFAQTLMELSGLLAHVLGFYQGVYASEAFLGTARSARSLVRHGRRLGYEPDPGLAACGHVAVEAAPGPGGTVARGFALSSVPSGETKAQRYETLSDVAIHPERNAMRPAASMAAVALAGTSTFSVGEVGLGLSPEDVVMVESAGALSAHLVVSVHESRSGTGNGTELQVEPALPSWTAAGARLWARPQEQLRLFGWRADPALFSDSALAGGALATTGYPRTGYVVGGGVVADELYLDVDLKKPLGTQPIARLTAGAVSAFRVKGERTTSVALQHVEEVITRIVTGWDATAKAPIFGDQTLHPTVQIAGTVTALVVSDAAGTVARSGQDIRGSLWLSRWSASAQLVDQEPNRAPATAPIELDGAYGSLAPGQLVELSTSDGSVREIAEITSVATAPSGNALIGWRMVDPVSGGHAWTLGDLVLNGNVAAISHGETVEELLGDSDGVTPFLKFALKKSPLTYLPTANGAAAELEVRVHQVLWQHVESLYASSPTDRHYLIQRDENAATTIIFGDGRHGAVPPSGKRSVTASYRVGLGAVGIAASGAVSRIVRANPLVKSASNGRPVPGGADPADASAVRTQATRFIRTFDRAVSVQDHRDLTLLFPGVARAAATWQPLASGQEGIHLVAAAADGSAPASVAAVRAFLDARRDTAVPLEIGTPLAVPIALRLAIAFDAAFLQQQIEDAIRGQLFGAGTGAPGMFTFAGRSLGEPAFLSEVYERVRRVDGLTRLEVRAFQAVRDPGTATYDVVVAGPDEWLSLPPANLSFELLPEVA